MGDILTLSKKNTVKDAVEMILQKKIGIIPVLDDEKHPIGVITKTNLLKVLLKVLSE